MKTFVMLVALVFVSFACLDKVDPNVDTLYYEDGKDWQGARNLALPKLLEHYSSSKKDRLAYEVISKKKGRLILNFTPSLKLLTLCGDPGSGWGPQLKDVDEKVLQKLVNDGITFDDLHSIGTLDSKYNCLLERNSPSYPIKTNGHPSI